MKNIHILPTDKPSRLWLNGFQANKLEISTEILTNAHQAQNIYITSDEEIKEDDCMYYKHFGEDIVTKYNTWGGLNTNVNEHKDYYKKIILTTDQDLIKDGVQAIDDTFLEWIVKNPSCEFVEVDKNWNYPLDKSWEYKIIIPKEEPKQETPESIIQDIATHLSKTIPETLEYIEKFSKDLNKLKKEPKQETLEEAAEIEKIAMDKLKSKWGHLYTFGYPKRPFPTNYENDLNNVKVGLYEGAKWQQERMYSEKDVAAFTEWCASSGYRYYYNGEDWVWGNPYTQQYLSTNDLLQKFLKTKNDTQNQNRKD